MYKVRESSKKLKYALACVKMRRACRLSEQPKSLTFVYKILLPAFAAKSDHKKKSIARSLNSLQFIASLSIILCVSIIFKRRSRTDDDDDDDEQHRRFEQQPPSRQTTTTTTTTTAKWCHHH